MPSIDHLIEFTVASVAIILAPGPSVMFVIARAVAWGRATAVLTAAGNAIGLALLSLAIAVGLGPLLQSSPALLEAVQLLGGLYLVYLGVGALRHRHAHASDMLDTSGGRPSHAASVRQGLAVGVLNPKALVFFSAVFPQFLDPQAASITVQLALFGAIFAVLALVLDGTWGVVVGSSRDWFARSQGRLVTLRTMGGSVMVTLGVLVILPLAWGWLT